MKYLKLLIVIAGSMMIVACAAVYSTGKMGNKPLVLEAEEWEGTWVHKDGAVSIRVKDAQSGLVQVAWIENMKLESHTAHLARSGEWIFGSIGADDKNRFIWARIRKEDNQLIMWTPAVDKFKALVAEGTLPGTVDEDGNVLLGKFTAEHYSMITSESRDILFDWERPVVMMRLEK